MRDRATVHHGIGASATPLTRSHTETPLERAAEHSLLVKTNGSGHFNDPHICFGEELAGLDQLEFSLPGTQRNAEMETEQLVEMPHAATTAGGEFNG